MAQPIACDICQTNQAVQLLTNLGDGTTIAMCPACLPEFYGQSVLTLMEAGEHGGPAGKCQACRRFHERMTTPVAPISADPPAPGADDTQADDTAVTAADQ